MSYQLTHGGLYLPSEDGGRSLHGEFDRDVLRGVKGQKIPIVLIPQDELHEALKGLIKGSRIVPGAFEMFMALDRRERAAAGGKKAA